MEGEVTRGDCVRKMLFDHGPEGNERVSKSEYLGEGCSRQRLKTLTSHFPLVIQGAEWQCRYAYAHQQHGSNFSYQVRVIA